MMNTGNSSRYILVCLLLLCLASSLLLRYNLHRLPFHLIFKDSYSQCFTWKSITNQSSTVYDCPHYVQMSGLVWTYDGTGFMKYLQWIVTRKLANVQVTRLDDHCQITYQHFYSLIDTNRTFIQVYIMPLSVSLVTQSHCAIKINHIAIHNIERVNQIYFKRKSVQSTLFFQQLDTLTFRMNLTSTIEGFHFPETERTDYLISHRWLTIYSEDLIKSDLVDCEKVLTNLLRLLGLDTSLPVIQNIIEYDSHRFIDDATWWDQSDVAQRVLTRSLPSRSSGLNYSNDFYHLHGNRPFIEYLYRTRRCFTEGVFSQLQVSTITNRSSTDRPDRCPRKPFDCAFSDLYSFADREQIYQPFDSQHYFDENTVRCGFAIPSIYDQVRQRYARNHTCQTIIFTLITGCYDPLPQINGPILSSFCFVALLDSKTINAFKSFYKTKPSIEWDMIDLGVNATSFSVAAKTVETLKILGQRLFPLAKWIIWLDGKARMENIIQLLIEAKAPVIGAAHPDRRRTSASEVNPTIGRLNYREKPFSQRMNDSVLDIRLQEAEYIRDGFYAQSNALGLKLYDIAVFLYRNNHPCTDRYLCAWHNEINYYSYRGQLSVYYPAVRLNLTNYLDFLPHQFYSTTNHRSVC